MNRFSMTSALFPRRTVSRIAVRLTFVVALASALVFAQGVSSKSKTEAGESSSAAPKLIQPENWPESCSPRKAAVHSSSMLAIAFFICRRTFRIRSTSVLPLSRTAFSVFASAFKLCRAHNISWFTAGADRSTLRKPPRWHARTLY
jgi:hypothetical protein